MAGNNSEKFSVPNCRRCFLSCVTRLQFFWQI